MLYENAILVENDSYKNRYPAPKDFIALVEGQVGVINFIKDPEISGPVVKTAFTVIKVASYAYVFPRMQVRGIQLIKDYLSQVPVVETALDASLSIINLPNAFVQWAWDPTKYLIQDSQIGHKGCPTIPLFNEDGTPKMVEVSNREQTKFLGKLFGIVISAVASPFIIQNVMDK